MQFFVQAYTLLFVASSPLVYVAMYVALTPCLSTKERWLLAKKACHISFCILLCVGTLGSLCLQILGVHIYAFRIAAGFVMGRIGLQMLKPTSIGSMRNLSFNDVVTPIAFPMISGPGAISALLVLRTMVNSQGVLISMYAAVCLLMGTFYGLFYVASHTSHRLPPFALQIIYKLSGVFVLSLACNFIADGLRGAAES